MDNLITFFASFLIWIMFAGLIVLWIVDGKFKREQALHAFVSSLVVWVISQMLKSLIAAPRPFSVNGEGVKTLTIPLDNGFPSVHAAAAFAMAITIWLHNKEIGKFYLILASVVSIGRIMANVHYPIDVVAGAALGLITGFGVEKLHVFNLIKKKR